MTIVAKKPTIRGRRSLLKSATPYALIAPAGILVAIFVAVPVVIVAAYSLFDYKVSKPWDNGFAGLGNFQQLLFQDPLFWQSLGVTAAWVGVEVTLQLFFGLGLAVALNRVFRGRSLARALAFAPWAISGVLTTQIWLLIFSPTTGIAQVMGYFGNSSDFSPLASGDSAFWSAILAELWRGLPFFAIMLLADMQSISPELYEAADVDGAGVVARFRFITLPHLRNAIIVTTLLRAVWEFNNVDLLYTLTGGGPANATTTLPLYVVNQAVTDQNFGYGAALSVVGFIILLLFSVGYLRLNRKADKEAVA